MLFNTWVFVLFFATGVAVYHTLPHRWQNVWLLAGSYVFYGYWDWRFTGLLALSTVVDFILAQRIEGSEEPRARRRFLFGSIVLNLGLLGFFKYFDFFVDSAAVALEGVGLEANVPLLRVVLPVGISFYTFQTLAYTIDVYRGQQQAIRDPISYAVYVAYFPQLVAGPIERAGRLLPQIQQPRKVRQEDWHEGAQLMLWGYVKKVAVADSLAPFVDRAFANPQDYGSVYLWLAMYGFALQIYCDFSGYTDIARGTSRLLGIRLMENFRQPYLSQNVTEFWRRWHISLSTWLRDYLYIPLGGNRHGQLKQYRNLMVTMLLGGLWHGAAWTFILWGGLHGLYLAAHRVITRGRKIGFLDAPRSWLGLGAYLPRWFVTFHLVCLAWIPFRAESWDALRMYADHLFRVPSADVWNAAVASGLIDNLAFYGILVALLDVKCWVQNSELPFLPENRWWVRGLAYGAGLVVLAFIRGGEGESFIYFQF